MRRFSAVAVMGVMASLALSGSAFAANVSGTNGGDRLGGTARADSINARAGNDRVNARSGRDRVRAGRGRDRVNGGAGSDRLAGQAGSDVITGGSGSDVITGGAGNDRIDARDGAVDTVTCGEGDDVAKLDADDVIADATQENPNGSCERVIRPGADGGHDSGNGGSSEAGRDCPEKGNRPRPNGPPSEESGTPRP